MQMEHEQLILKEILKDKKSPVKKPLSPINTPREEKKREARFIEDYGGSGDNQNYLFVPVNSNFEDRPVYVNPKQYKAILNRRIKKINKKLKTEQKGPIIKSKIKYQKRSSHAKKRKRDKNGKFITKKKNVEVSSDKSKDNQ